METGKKTPLEKLLEYKNDFYIFEDMSKEDIVVIISKVKFKSFNESETIIEEGDDTKLIYIILSGKCIVSSSNKMLGTLEPDDVFGEVSGLMQGPRQATVKAETKVKVVSFLINYDEFTRHIVPFAYLYRNASKLLSKKLLILNTNLKGDIC